MEIIENLDAPLGNSVFSQGQSNSKNLLELFNQQKAYNSSNLFPFQLHLLSYTAGLVAGQSWREEKIKTAEKQPIAYNYNGVQLPPLPEWDSERYPYAMIVYYPNNSEAGRYYITFFSHPPSYFSRNLSGFLISKSVPWEVKQYRSNGSTKWNWAGDDERGDSTYDHILFNTGATSTLVWANVDFTIGNTIYLAASDPIPVYELDEPEKQPIGYSYNGVILPALPEWDREMYPYAVIWRDSCNVVLSVSAEPVIYEGFGGYFYDNDHMNRLVYVIQNGNFVLDDDYDKDLYRSSSEIIWTNHPVLVGPYDDNAGDLKFSASDPIPYNGQLQYCLYNETKMLALPEWDTETYKYALIVAPDTDLYPHLVVSSNPFYPYVGTNGKYYLTAGNGAKRIAFTYCGTTWLQGGMFKTYYQGVKDDWYVWANHDIIDRDGCIGEVGSVYREGSEPIPIYE